MDLERIIYKFGHFNNIRIGEKIKWTPDVFFYFCQIDGEDYVLAETDFFERTHEASGIKEVYDKKVECWLTPDGAVEIAELDADGEWEYLKDPSVQVDGPEYPLRYGLAKIS